MRLEATKAAEEHTASYLALARTRNQFSVASLAETAAATSSQPTASGSVAAPIGLPPGADHAGGNVGRAMTSTGAAAVRAPRGGGVGGWRSPGFAPVLFPALVAV